MNAGIILENREKIDHVPYRHSVSAFRILDNTFIIFAMSTEQEQTETRIFEISPLTAQRICDGNVVQLDSSPENPDQVIPETTQYVGKLVARQTLTLDSREQTHRIYYITELDAAVVVSPHVPKEHYDQVRQINDPVTFLEPEAQDVGTEARLIIPFGLVRAASEEL
jgi:hypothetical protein